MAKKTSEVLLQEVVGQLRTLNRSSVRDQLRENEATKRSEALMGQGEVAQEQQSSIIGGAEDPCTLNGGDMEKLATKLQNIGLSDVTCKILEGTRHESLNEINRDQTTKQFIKWLEERF